MARVKRKMLAVLLLAAMFMSPMGAAFAAEEGIPSESNPVETVEDNQTPAVEEEVTEQTAETVKPAAAIEDPEAPWTMQPEVKVDRFKEETTIGDLPSEGYIDGDAALEDDKKCTVDWYSEGVIDRDTDDYANKGYTYKVRDPEHREKQIAGILPEKGNFEMQHWSEGSTLIWRIFLATMMDLEDAKIYVEFNDPNWTVDPDSLEAVTPGPSTNPALGNNMSHPGILTKDGFSQAISPTTRFKGHQTSSENLAGGVLYDGQGTEIENQTEEIYPLDKYRTDYSPTWVFDENNKPLSLMIHIGNMALRESIVFVMTGQYAENPELNRNYGFVEETEGISETNKFPKTWLGAALTADIAGCTEPTPEPDPTPNPDPKPEPNPEPPPDPTPELTPDPTPEPTPQPIPNPQPAPNGSPIPRPTPLPQPNQETGRKPVAIAQVIQKKEDPVGRKPIPKTSAESAQSISQVLFLLTGAAGVVLLKKRKDL